MAWASGADHGGFPTEARAKEDTELLGHMSDDGSLVVVFGICFGNMV